MKRKNISVAVVSVLFLCMCMMAGRMATPAMAEESGAGGQMAEVLSNLQLAGGISGGYFYASHPGEEASGSEFLLSNLLVELSCRDEAFPIGFVAAFGETSTPSVLDAPENNNTLAVEYAGLAMSPVANLSLEVGLLGPNSGFEETYTFANSNILLGAVASQQPYNAYGAKFGYETGGLSFWGGYYRDRLDDEEYDAPADAWELGVEGELAGNAIGLYHYHVGGFRYLTGVVIERNIEGMAVGINVDYWTWGGAMEKSHGSDAALGGAVYVSQRFGDLSIPLRIEYITQNESQIYIENPETDGIFTAVITPTYHVSENAYARAEASFVMADGGFADRDGERQDSNVGLAVEFGMTF